MDSKENKKNDLKKSFINIVSGGMVTRVVITGNWALVRYVPIKKLGEQL